jgi:hypothetical protein
MSSLIAARIACARSHFNEGAATAPWRYCVRPSGVMSLSVLDGRTSVTTRKTNKQVVEAPAGSGRGVTHQCGRFAAARCRLPVARL